MINRVALPALLCTVFLFNTAYAVEPPSPTPPEFNTTKQIGSQIKQGQANAGAWEASLLGQAAQYDVYTKSVDDSTLVLNTVKNCKDDKGGKSVYCNFTLPGTGLDLLASSLIGPQGYAADQRQAALTYILKMTNGTPLSYPGDDTVFNDKKTALTTDGTAYFAQAFKQLPMLSIAQNSLMALFSDRDRLPGLAGSLPVGDKGAASLLEMLDFEASRRYMTPGWYDGLNGASDQAVMREMAYMMAFQNYMAVKAYEQNQRIEALLVAQISATNNMGAMLTAGGNAQQQQQKVNKKLDKF